MIRTNVVARPREGFALPTRSSFARASTTTLLAALAYAAVGQGGFYPRELRVTVLIIGVAALVAGLAVRPGPRDLSAPTIAAAALAGWYLWSAHLAGDPAGAYPALALLGALAATVAIVRRAESAEREVLLRGLIVLGVLVGLTGWVGVAWHQSPRAQVDGGLWRAASTITYANATAAFIGALALLALARIADDRIGRAYAAAACVLGTALLATASRGGVAAFGLGGLVLLCTSDRRRALRIAPVALGTIVAFVALLPSMPEWHGPHAAIALAGLAAGTGIALMRPRAAAAVALTALTLLAVVPGTRHQIADSWQAVQGGRITLSSPDRAHETSAAVALVREHPLRGVGPGQVDLTWPLPFPYSFAEMSVAYAHNEFLQVAGETGLVGSAILVAGLLAVAFALLRARRHTGVVTAGVLAALVALAVQSTTDFLWHVPVIALLGAVLVGVALPSPHDNSATQDASYEEE